MRQVLPRLRGVMEQFPDPWFLLRLARYACLVVVFFPKFLWILVKKPKIVAFDWHWAHYESFYAPIFHLLQDRWKKRDGCMLFFFRFELGAGRQLPVLRLGLPALYRNFVDRKVVIAADASRYKKLPKTIRVQLFHGFASLGSGFPPALFINHFDIFFMPTYSLYEQFYGEYRAWTKGKRAFEVGYPKLDDLLRTAARAPDVTRTTLFYGPTYHREISSIFEFLPAIVQLCRDKEYRLLIKLHPYLYHRHSLVDSGGIDWVSRIAEYQRDYRDIVLLDRNLSAVQLGRYFAETDIFLTDVSGIGYEFVLATGRPIIFLGEKLKVPLEDLRSGRVEGYQKCPEIYWRGIIGPVVKEPRGLGEAVEALLTHNSYQQQIDEFRRSFVPNLGSASQVAVEIISDLLDEI